MANQKRNHSSKPNPEEDKSTYARLSGITFELLALNLSIIGGGYYLDQYVGFSVPWILLIFIFLSVAATIYYLLKKFGT